MWCTVVDESPQSISETSGTIEDMDYVSVVSDLSSTSLALVSSLVGANHFLVQAAPKDVAAAVRDLQDTASDTLGLACANVICTALTNPADFAEHVLVREERDVSGLDSARIANVVLAVGLDKASRDVQILALETMRAKRMTTKHGLHLTPKHFCLVAVCESSDGSWPEFKTKHLNDRFWMSHAYQRDGEGEDGSLRSAAEDDGSNMASNASTRSVVRRAPGLLAPLSETAVEEMQKKVSFVNATAEMRRYEHNIVTFMRLHRAVAGGISAISPRHIGHLTKVLAVMNDVDYVTPSLVSLAARKVLSHRIVLATPDNERSMQWGSDREAVKAALEGVTADTIVEDIVLTVPAPL